jgi:hypothetical protein
LAFLAGSQVQEGPLAGSFGSGVSQGNVAITSLAALAFLSGGHHPSRGQLGGVVERALQYVLRQSSAAGLLHYPETSLRGPMYNHGFGTLFLAEAYGTISRREVAANVRDKLGRAVRLLLETQNHEGGWRYQPEQVEQADLSVTVAQVMALRAARDVGLDVPKANIERCAAFLRRCQLLPEGGYRYMPQTGTPSFPLTAAGLIGLHCCGVYEGPEIKAGRAYLQGFLPSKRPTPTVNPDYYLYGHYYAALAVRQAGGQDWKKWYAAIRNELCQLSRPVDSDFPNRRQRDGSWADAKFGTAYATALACIILQLPRNHLPIFQN